MDIMDHLPNGSPVMVSPGVYGDFGANRRRAGTTVFQDPSIPQGLFREFFAHGWKGDNFSNASHSIDFIDDGAKQRQAGSNNPERRFNHWPVHGWGKHVFSSPGKPMQFNIGVSDTHTCQILIT